MALGAGLADLAIIFLLMLVHGLAQRNLKGPLKNFFPAVHLLIAVFIALLAVCSQMLFLNTAEVLDLALISFAVREAPALLKVAASEQSLATLEPALLALAFLLLLVASTRSQRPIIRYLAYASLALPIFFLPVSHAADFLLQKDLRLPTAFQRKDSLYLGTYADLSNKEKAWNASSRQGWSMGILSGMTVGSAFGRLEYLAYKDKAGVEELYRVDDVSVAESTSRPNVLMIILESVRYDVLGVYGQKDVNQPSVTPFLDEYARQSQVVERAYTTISHTSKALIGIYCGTFPRFSSEIVESQPYGLDNVQCLPGLLDQAGYASAHFQTAPAEFEGRQQLLENLRFDHFTTQESFAGQNWEQLGYLGFDDRAMLEPAVEWMQEQQKNKTPYFASLLTVVTHHPYAYPGSVQPISSPADAFQAYLGALQYTDSLLEELFGRLEKEGLLENTLVIITGDHGEGFAEHGQIAHNGTAYDDGMRVPIIIRPPEKSFTPGTIGGLRQHLDIVPTILETVGIKVTGLLPGNNLLEDRGGHEEIITSCFYDDYCLTHINNSGEKLIYLYGRRNIEYYDLIEDSTEMKNLYDTDAGMEDIIEERLLSAIRWRNSFEAVWQ